YEGSCVILNELMMGFDVREMWLDIDHMWDEERRKTFLLDISVRKPLSVDRTVWPSIFDIAGENPRYHRTNIPVDTQIQKTYTTDMWNKIIDQHKHLVIPDWRGYQGTLWDKLSTLKSQVSDAWGSQWRPSYLIAVTKFVDSCDTD